jgi:hypothetical protein
VKSGLREVKMWYQWSKKFTDLMDSLVSDYKAGLVSKRVALAMLRKMAGSIREYNNARQEITNWK